MGKRCRFAPEYLYELGKSFKQKVSAQYIILAAPEICSFDGIRVFINYKDHLPPHFHAEVGEETALIDIKQCCLHKGSLPPAKLKKVLQWAAERKDELLNFWNLAVDKKPLGKIPPPTKSIKKSTKPRKK